jgi:hypothetical protein
MVGNIFKALSRIALVSLASLVGCVDVDDAPELGETADSVTSWGVEASANATSKISAEVANSIASKCNQLEWGQVCSYTDNTYNDFIGVFYNNRGGANRATIKIWKSRPGDDLLVWECGEEYVPYGYLYRCPFIYATPGVYYKTCVRLGDGRHGCTDWLPVQ